MKWNTDFVRCRLRELQNELSCTKVVVERAKSLSWSNALACTNFARSKRFRAVIWSNERL